MVGWIRFYGFYKEKGWDAINLLNPTATFLLQSRITNVLCCGLVHQLRRDVIGSFYWYWWNCLPSSFKLSFHNVGFIQRHLPICRIYLIHLNWRTNVLKPKGQTGMDNPKIQATLSTRHRMKTNKAKTHKNTT